MRGVLCVKLQQPQILPGLPPTYHPPTGSRAHEETAGECYAVGMEKALIHATLRAGKSLR